MAVLVQSAVADVVEPIRHVRGRAPRRTPGRELQYGIGNQVTIIVRDAAGNIVTSSTFDNTIPGTAQEANVEGEGGTTEEQNGIDLRPPPRACAPGLVGEWVSGDVFFCTVPGYAANAYLWDAAQENGPSGNTENDKGQSNTTGNDNGPPNNTGNDDGSQTFEANVPPSCPDNQHVTYNPETAGFFCTNKGSNRALRGSNVLVR